MYVSLKPSFRIADQLLCVDAGILLHPILEKWMLKTSPLQTCIQIMNIVVKDTGSLKIKLYP